LKVADSPSPDSHKLYRKIALAIAAAIADGRYGPGEKLQSERELADSFGVSRPTIRDAMIALEFQGLVEARQGSGVYVNAAAPVPEDVAELEVNALEWTEARRLFEGEACALSAAIASEEQLTRLDRLVDEMAAEGADDQIERLELEFHLAVALATGNVAIAAGLEELWALRQQSPLCAAALRRARAGSGGNFVGEHRQIVAALRERDPKAARRAIHSHLAQVIDDLLALAEADALKQTRQKMAEQRRALARRNEI
jgi:GntR family transcriptional regulator, hexuronate regulon transcriptional repressor